ATSSPMITSPPTTDRSESGQPESGQPESGRLESGRHASDREAALAAVPARAAGVLTVDLAAIAENYARLKAAFQHRGAGAVVKADAYGLGAGEVAPALVKAGARSVFVAQLDEALKLRPLLDRCHPAISLYVLNGLMRGAEADYADNNILPVLNSLGEIEAWSRFARRREKALPAAVHIDSGMCRLGLPPDEVERLRGDRAL